jgi:type II secretory pathway component PulF
MGLFSYSGLDAKGVEQKGQIEADSEKDVVRILRERSIYVLKVREGGGAGGGDGFRDGYRRILQYLSPRQYARIGTVDLVMFFRQMALMLRAGYTLVAALEVNYEMVPKLRLRRALKRMTDEIRRGSSFSAMIAEEKKIFPAMIANLVASGEQSGNLDTILDRLADGLERSRELKRQLVAALIYPSFVLLASIGVVIFLVVGVIPRFATFLTARNAELPGSTQLLMDVSDWALTYGTPLAVVAGLATFGVLAAYTTVPGKRAVDRVILALPVVGTAVLFAAMAQAAWSLAMLLKSGVTALHSLNIVSSVIDNRVISDCFRCAADGLLEGRALSKAFDQAHIPLMMRHMMAVGESSGQLETVMDSVGEYYQKELSAKVKIIALSIEPTLILMVGAMVGFVYYAFFQAVMSVSKGGM